MTETENSGQQKPILSKIELPKGGGAISNVGEKFSVNAITGTGSASIPLPVSPGRNGFNPQLSLSYDSGAGNSPFGLGWNLALGNITRKTAKGLPQYNDAEESDVFVIAGAEDLVPVLEKNGTNWERKEDSESDADFKIYYYRPRTEGSFSLIQKWVKKSNPKDVHWQVISADNTTIIYGATSVSRIESIEQGTYSWLICESRDNRGNIIKYEYIQENQDNIDAEIPSEFHRIKSNTSFTQKYIKTISYCNQLPNIADDWHFQLVFDYGGHDENRPSPTEYLTNDYKWKLRSDPFSSYRSGFEIRTYRLCERVLLFHQFDDLNGGEPTLVQATKLEYEHDAVVTKLLSASQTGYIKTENGYSSKQTPPVEFQYSKPIIGQTIKKLPRENLEQIPVGLQSEYQFVDLEGEGLAGILTEKDGGWFYKSNNGNGHFQNTKLLTEQPSLIGSGATRIQDIDGDGNKELVVMNQGVEGYFNYTDSKWNHFTPFKEMPNLNWQDPNLKLIDLNGDGFADILITEDNVLRWFPSKAKEGYESSKTVLKKLNEQEGPALVFADTTQSIYLADMSGDGLTDIVRVRNKDICYWPNLGYAQFGAKITMNHAPVFDHPDQFNQRQVRLADIDGTGTTDILYFNDKGANFWINQAGNGWSNEFSLDQFPGIDNTTNVQLVDLLGTGTPCLTWSSILPIDSGSPIKYIDLMEPSKEKPLGKPYLLNQINNNMGKIDRFQYAPSTQFYLADKKAGKPWITKLHFPVYVVERVETIDEISKARLTVSYKYHHGYFDSIEREFRGFGMVEQLDSETFEEFGETNPNEEQIAHFISPILSKTWFHTGAYIDQKSISDYYKENEYFREKDALGAYNPIANYLLPDSVVDLISESNFSIKREAYRAMRGQTLRQEIYALDSSEKELIPYTITETNSIIREIQPRLSNKFGVFMTVPNESITFNYERDCCDPRVSHAIMLNVDEYGTPLRSAEVVYPRRQNGQNNIPNEQLEMHIVLSENRVTHKDANADFYALRIPFESKNFDITGVALPENQLYFTANQLREALDNVQEIPFYPNPLDKPKAKRLLSWQKSYFWNKNQTERLPLGEVEWPILSHNAETAVFTPKLIAATYEDKLTAETITDAGGYILNDGYWWNPGMITLYKYHDIDKPTDDRDRSNPFLFPIEVEDPLEKDPTKRARAFYDSSWLIATSADDPEGYTTHSFIDYRTLAPYKLTDINENISEVLTDELGMVIVSSNFGTEELADGTVYLNGDLSIDDYQPIPIDTIAVDKIVASPHSYLQGTSAFFYYDLTAWMDRKEPPQFISIARETHTRTDDTINDTEVQIAIGYSDGFGRELQQKVKVEPGISHLNNGQGGLLIDEFTGEPLKEAVENRWLSSGRTVLNNKEKPIKQYEPYYIDSHHFISEEDITKIGLTPLLYYDPLMRLIRTDTPDGFFSKVEFSAWESKTYDLNDTILESPQYIRIMNNSIPATQKEKDTLIKAAKHANTFSKAVFDTLGRPFKSIERDEHDKEYVTYATFNITGQPLTVTDPRQFDLNRLPDRENAPIHNYEHVYDMQGQPLYTKSIDAGESWAIINVLGNPVGSWSPRSYYSSVEYDVMHRPIALKVVGNEFKKPITVEKMIYAPTDTLASKNLRGQLIATYDQVGKNEIVRVGFKGDPLETNKRFISIFKPDPV